MPETFVYPPRNLPGSSDNWGRAVEQRNNLQEKDQVQLTQRVDNGLRAANGQLAVIAEQIDTISGTVTELSSRSTHQASPGSLTLVYGTGWGQKGPVSTSVTFPAALEGRRTATLVGSGIFEWAGGSSDDALGIYLRLEVRQNGNVIWSTTKNVSANPFIPAAFDGDSFSIVAAVQVPAGTEPTFDLRLYGYRSASGGNSSDAGRATNLNLSLSYGDRY